MVRTLALALALASTGAMVCVAGALAAPAPTRVVVGQDLARQPIALASIGPDAIGVVQHNTIARLSPDGVLAILPPRGEVVWQDDAVPLAGDLLSGGGGWVIELTDGQRLRGRPGASGDPEIVSWVELPGLAPLKLELPIERVRLIARSATARPAATSVDDRVETANGDVLLGFVASVGSAVEVELDNGVAALELGLISRIDLANPAMQGTQPMVWLVDGSVLAAERFVEASSGRLAFELAVEPAAGAPPRRGPRIDVPIGSVAAIELEPGRLVSLVATSEVESGSGTSMSSERRWTPAARLGDPARAPLGLADIELPGPMEIRAELPAAADRFWTEAVLAKPSAWSDATLVVELERSRGQRDELARVDLSRDRRAGVIAVDLDAIGVARTLVVRLESGARGPIRDRVILRQPALSLTPAAP